MDYILVDVLPRHLRNEIVNRVWPKWIKVITMGLFRMPAIREEIG